MARCRSSPSAAPQAASTASPATSPAGVDLPVCNTPIAAIFATLITPTGGGAAGDSIFCLTVKSETDLSSRLLESPTKYRQLLAADSRIVVWVDGPNVDGSNDVAVFDLVSGANRVLGTLGSFSVGDPGPLGGVLSPDGSQLAIGGAHKLVVVQIQSGPSRTLATLTGDQWLMPLRWTAAGIIVHKVGFEGMGDFGLLIIDPATGTISTVNQGPNNQIVMSPNGKFFAVTAHVELGDGPSVRYPWSARTAARRGSSPKRIAGSRHSMWATTGRSCSPRIRKAIR